MSAVPGMHGAVVVVVVVMLRDEPIRHGRVGFHGPSYPGTFLARPSQGLCLPLPLHSGSERVLAILPWWLPGLPMLSRAQNVASQYEFPANLSSVSRSVVLAVRPCFIMRFQSLLALAITAILCQCGPNNRHVREALADLLGAPLHQLPEAQLVAALDAGTTSGYACSFAVCFESFFALGQSTHSTSAMLWPCAMAT